MPGQALEGDAWHPGAPELEAVVATVPVMVVPPLSVQGPAQWPIGDWATIGNVVMGRKLWYLAGGVGTKFYNSKKWSPHHLSIKTLIDIVKLASTSFCRLLQNREIVVP